MFHCTHGKYRTGILAMLLLKISNVKDEYIVKNYSECYCSDCSSGNHNKNIKNERKYRKNY